MDHERILELVESAEVSTDVTREEASNMLVFARVSQWDDDIANDVLTQFRGTFDIVKKKRNRILGELWSNPIDITFKAKDGADPEGAETLGGMYRTDMITSEEALETAVQDQVDCGFGAFRLVTEYESTFDDLNNYQKIKAEPINEANNCVYFDSNAIKKDKSDARWACIVTTFTKEGWKTYCDENDIEYEEHPAPFKSLKKSSNLFWSSKDKEIKIGEFYHKEKKRERIYLFEDPLGQIKAYSQREVKSVLDELEDAGFIKVGEKYKERWIVTKKIVTGSGVVKSKRIPGEHIPIIPVYGDWSRVENREIWRGLYHDAQDGQRLHNFNLSYLADVVAKGPRQKPVFYQGQIQGLERFWTQSGASDNFPYHLVNEKSPSGQPYPAGPIDYSRPPEIPQAAAALLQLTKEAVEDVTGGEMSLDQMMSGQVTEGQTMAAQSVQNMETFLYQNSFALAMKQCGRVYASMAAELYDVPREATITLPDGTEKEVMVMEAVFDEETQEEVVINDLTRGRFEVYADTGPSYQTQKEQARAELQNMYGALQGTQEGQIILLTYLTLLEGPKMDHLRDYARKQLILQGILEPESDEEIAMVQQAAQAQGQPDAATLMAMAEMEKAKADQMGAQNDQANTQVKAFEAETKRVKTMAEVQKMGIESNKLASEIKGNELDNISKLQAALMPAPMRMQ